MSDENKYDDVEFEVNTLKKTINDLEKQVYDLKEVLKAHDLQDMVPDISFMSEEEEICINGIRHLKKLYDNGTFEKSDTQQLEILTKLLMQIRNKTETPVKKSKLPDNVKDLFKIAGNND